MTGFLLILFYLRCNAESSAIANHKMPRQIRIHCKMRTEDAANAYAAQFYFCKNDIFIL